MIKSTLENCGTMKRVLTFMPLETGQKWKRNQLNLVKYINPQIQETENTHTHTHTHTHTDTLQHTIVKLLKSKDKEKILNSWKQYLTYRRKIISLTVDFSSETVEAKRKCHTIFQVLKEKNFNLASYIHWTYSSEIKGKSRHSKIRKN